MNTDLNDYTVLDLECILAEAEQAARDAASKFFTETLNGKDGFPCGFAWVEILGVKGNTKLGRRLKQAGVKLDSYSKCFKIWNPSKFPAQNVDTLEQGALAAADVLKKYGFKAYSSSRWD